MTWSEHDPPSLEEVSVSVLRRGRQPDTEACRKLGRVMKNTKQVLRHAVCSQSSQHTTWTLNPDTMRKSQDEEETRRARTWVVRERTHALVPVLSVHELGEAVDGCFARLVGAEIGHGQDGSDRSRDGATLGT